MLRNFLALSEQTIDAIDDELEKLLEHAGVTCASLCEKSGYVISSKGTCPYLDSEDMGALSAGILGALGKMSNLANSEELTVTLHSKDVENIHFHKVSSRIYVVIFFSDRTPQRQIRVSARELSKKLHKVLAADETLATLQGSTKFIEKKLDDLFSDV